MLERPILSDAVSAGLTEREIAAKLGVTKAAVHYWLGVHGLKTRHLCKRDVSPPEARAGRAAGSAEITSTCTVHGPGRFILEASGYYRCVACRAERVAERRRVLKATLVAEAGGACVLCGYDRSVRALEFHHVDPSQKLFSVSATGTTRSLDRLRAEVAKCVLLCSNCHAEVESGESELPSKLTRVWRHGSASDPGPETGPKHIGE